MKKISTIHVCGALAMAAVLGAFWQSPQAEAQQRPPEPPSVGVMQAHMVRMAPKVTLPGTVMSRNDSQLASEVEGRVSWVAEVGTIVKENDVVAIRDAGAYGAAMASNYNRRPLPAEVLVDDGTWRVIRRRQTIDDQLALET